MLLADEDPLLSDDEIEIIRAGARPPVRFASPALGHEKLVLRFHGFAADDEGGRLDAAILASESAFLEALESEG